MMGMLIDTKETKASFEMAIDLPGVDKADIDMVIDEDQGLLTIKAEKKSTKTEEDADTQYKRVERFSGTMSRTMTLPENTNRDKIEATFDNGVLIVHIPKLKADEEKPVKTVKVK